MLARIGYEHKNMGTFMGLYEIVKFTEIIQDSTNLHDNTPPTSFAGGWTY